MLNILFITHYATLYGANKSLLQLIIELKTNHKVNPTVLAPENGSFIEHLERENICYIISKWYNWRINKTNGYIFKGKMKSFLNTFYFSKVLKELRVDSKSYDIVHTNTSVTHLGAFISNKMKIPHVWHFREYGEDDYDLAFYMSNEKAYKIMEKYSTAIVAISNDIASHYKQFIEPTKFKVIYNGVEMRQSLRSSFEPKISNSSIQAVVVGAILPKKNQFEALLALRVLVQDYGVKNFILNFIGSGDQAYIASMQEFVLQNNLNLHVKFWGYRSDVESLISEMDIGIVTSYREAFGRVTVEYMKHFLPVVASNVGANSEIIEHQKSGILYDLGDLKQLANALFYLYKHPDIRMKYGYYANNVARNMFDSELNSDQIFNLYIKLLNIK